MADLEKDVNNIQESSTDNSSRVEDVKKDTDIDLSDDVSRAIPYGRFKEKVEQTKNLERQIKKLQEDFENQIADRDRQWKTYYEAEISSLTRKQPEESYDDPDDYLDPSIKKLAQQYEEKLTKLSSNYENLNKKLSSFESIRESERLKGEIKRLKEIYPSLSEEHVLSIHKVKGLPLDECAEYSHKYFEDNIKTRYDRMMESKKQAAKKIVLTNEGKINIKPEEKPKSFKEAREFVLNYLGE